MVTVITYHCLHPLSKRVTLGTVTQIHKYVFQNSRETAHLSVYTQAVGTHYLLSPELSVYTTVSAHMCLRACCVLQRKGVIDCIFQHVE